MGTDKKCYKCLTEANAEAKACPRCGAKLGPKTHSGIAAKPGSPLLKILFAVITLAVIGKLAVHSRGAAPAPELVKITTGLDAARDGAIQKIKEKGAGELSTVGVADVGYKDDTFCVYVDQRFKNLSRDQQVQLLGIVAGEWKKAIGKDSTAVKIFEAGTENILAELVV